MHSAAFCERDINSLSINRFGSAAAAAAVAVAVAARTAVEAAVGVNTAVDLGQP